MYPAYNIYPETDLQKMLWQSVSQLDKFQQIKLLEFINSLFLNVKQESNKLLSYAGYFPTDELTKMKTAISDCENIDENEW